MRLSHPHWTSEQYIDHGPSRIPVRRLLAHGIAAGNFDCSPFCSYDPRRLAPLIEQLAQLIRHLRSDNIKLVYGDYGLTYRAHFIDLANPEFIEYHLSTVGGSARKKRAEVKSDFVFVFSRINHIKVFEKFIQDYRIICQVESFGEYVIYKNFEGSPNSLQAIRKLPIDPNFS